ALDTLGKNLDPDQVRSLYDGYVKAIGVEGADLNMDAIFLAAKRAKAAGGGMSNRFLMTIAPGLMQDMGPERFGTAMGSMQSQVIGGRATKQSKKAQKAFGLRDRKGRFIDGDMLMRDPDKFIEKHILERLKKDGVNIDDPVAVSNKMSQLFSNQLVADIM